MESTNVSSHKSSVDPPEYHSDFSTHLSSRIRKTVKARSIAGVVCATLPVAIREELGIADGDLVMVELDKDNRRILITKE